MRIFKLDDNFSVVCENYSTRNSWGHTAVIMLNGIEVGTKTRIRYYNRTWEPYTYHDVLLKAIDKIEKKILKKFSSEQCPGILIESFREKARSGNF